MAERDDANNDRSDDGNSDGNGDDNDNDDGDGDGEDDEESGDIPMNRSGLTLCEKSNPLDPFDDQFYPGGEFDVNRDIYVPEQETRQEENLGHDNGQALRMPAIIDYSILISNIQGSVTMYQVFQQTSLILA
jgi:hypothetical protein